MRQVARLNLQRNHSESREFSLARQQHMSLFKKVQTTMTNRIDTIATRQRTSRVHSIVFAAFVALAAVLSVSAVNTAVDVATPTHISQR